jgi:S-adenosylmethionine decarboxylase
MTSMQGLHLTADLRGCAPTQPLMTQAEPLRALCLAAARAAGLQAVGELFHRFAAGARPAGGAAAAPPGITGVVLLAQSHLAVHTWPEHGAVTIDVFVCNFEGDHSRGARLALEHLVQAFAPREVARQELRRAAAAAWPA